VAEIIWPQTLVDLLLELPDHERDLIFRKVSRLETFPEMYPIRTHGPFLGCRWFISTRWLIYYRVLGGEVHLRAIYPARIP
jgi:hypothetical protein